MEFSYKTTMWWICRKCWGLVLGTECLSFLATQPTQQPLAIAQPIARQSCLFEILDVANIVHHQKQRILPNTTMVSLAV